MSNKSVQIIRRLLPPTTIALGIAAIAAVQSGAPTPQASVSEISTTSSAESSEPKSTEGPHVKVNGRSVNLGTDGQAEVPLPGGGNAQVHVADGRTTVTTTSEPSDNSVNENQNGDLDVKVLSESTGGSSRSKTRVYSRTTEDGSTRSSTYTRVFGTDDAHIDVKTP